MNDLISTVSSDKQRDTTPIVTAAELADLAQGNSAFALDLYQALRKRAGNLFYSPYSISLALAMPYAGARGETEQQTAETLHFLLSQARLHPTFNALDLELARRGVGARGIDERGFRLNIANALWGQEDHHFLDLFLDTLAENYGAGLQLLDFVGAPEISRLAINNWVSEQTEGRIQDLIPSGAIDPMTRLVLTNAIYFNAAWDSQFAEYMTEDGPFYPLEDSSITVPLMRQTEHFAYGEGSGYQALELPYDGRQLSMIILLPGRGKFEKFEQSLTAPRLNSILGDLSPRRVALTMPKFKYESSFALVPTLADMGMPDAFSSEANFSGMDGSFSLKISDVIHKAIVVVNEKGTEAAAATAVIMAVKAMPIFEEPIEFTINHPFIFLIRDISTGAILFIGRVANPQGT